jgi:hypothetical protein
MCSACFIIFPTKLRTDRCPLCTKAILEYGPNRDSFPELLSKAAPLTAEIELIGESLDHKFFLEEVKKILSLATLLINKRELENRGGSYKD